LSNTDLCPKVKSVRSTRERYAMALVIAGIALKPGVVVGLVSTTAASQFVSTATDRRPVYTETISFQCRPV
jgi:hypothetical protein